MLNLPKDEMSTERGSEVRRILHYRKLHTRMPELWASCMWTLKSGRYPFYPVSGKERGRYRRGDSRSLPAGYYLCIVFSPCLNRYFSLRKRSRDSSFDSLSDVQATREIWCETKRETVIEETFTSPVRMYMGNLAK